MYIYIIYIYQNKTQSLFSPELYPVRVSLLHSCYKLHSLQMYICTFYEYIHIYFPIQRRAQDFRIGVALNFYARVLFFLARHTEISDATLIFDLLMWR